ncbi:MAG: glycosyl transferase family 2 [Pseudomonadota bacterium]
MSAGDGDLAIVIPTRQAAVDAPPAIAALRREHAGPIVICDSAGGATDLDAMVIQGFGGRGGQLRAGAAAAQTPWMLFLHADTRPAPGWRAAVDRFIAGGVGRAGYFDFTLDDAGRAARRLERAVSWRCRRLALPYGDQGLLIARTLYDAVGGFPDQPLMEDVAIVRRLGRRRLARIGVPATTSAAKFQRDGYGRRSAKNVALLALYSVGVPPTRLAKLYA